MQKRAYIYLPEKFADWETGYLAAELNTGESLRGGRWDVQMVSEDGGTVSSMGGLSATPDMAASDLAPDDGDLLVLCGGETWDAGRHRRVIDLAAQRLASGRHVA